MTFEGYTTLIVAVIFTQLLTAAVGIIAIILIKTRKWTALLWLLGFSTTYSLIDVGWRAGNGFDPSVVLVMVLLYLWQLFGIVTAIRGRNTTVRTS
ncbi:MAG TPA: hypothetical protein PKD28_00575 [Candidatus Saccharibacteria bacterium]|nr:hypothetical protein [Candidatus Saccharibacteria bacterium]